MPAAPVIIVCLRRPRSRDPNERRADPFWEFGSFGCTSCHSKNLMNPKRLDELEGSQLAFAQGGPLGFRLVHLTPPVRPTRHGHCCELLWNPPDMPLRYADAPVLIANDGTTDFPAMKRFLRGVLRDSWEGKFSSRFRSRRRPLPKAIASEIVRKYSTRRGALGNGSISLSYAEALPWPPSVIDDHRKATYRRLLGRPRQVKCGGHTSCTRRGTHQPSSRSDHGAARHRPGETRRTLGRAERLSG